eukprot:gnl/Chilomastix_caulleri/3528.p2 GENE.gnl/Chilomastix_caulleri/3528~~gnl/Chilomastix_caulleri/3528.p2  ORF type:complete len:114 (+),score=21.26 gnl/Chilomastix_caulleri/3528:113-454(+)
MEDQHQCHLVSLDISRSSFQPTPLLGCLDLGALRSLDISHSTNVRSLAINIGGLERLVCRGLATEDIPHVKLLIEAAGALTEVQADQPLGLGAADTEQTTAQASQGASSSDWN